MNKEILKKVIQLDLDKNLGLRRDELKYVVGRLQKVEASNFGSDQTWYDTIDSIVMSVRNNAISKEVKKQALSANQKCAVCQKPGEKITLMGGRQAFYCVEHKVASPAIKD